MKSKIENELKKRVLVLDGAMGTMLQKYNLREEDFHVKHLCSDNCEMKGNYDILSLTRPDIIMKVHEEYFKAGADIVETNTLNSNRISQADYGSESLTYEMNRQSALSAREVADKFTAQDPSKPRFVAGSMGPANRTASMSPDLNDPSYRNVDFDALADAYREQAEGLIDGGVDALLIETAFDTLNVKAALYAVSVVEEKRGIKIPVMVSATITDAGGRMLAGQTIEAFLISVSRFDLLSVGINCALGAEQMRPYLRRLSDAAPFYVSVYPNAGLPDGTGGYKETPENMAGIIGTFLDDKLINIVGGCCGTTPEHIKAIANIASNAVPRVPVGRDPNTLFLSGLEEFAIAPGMNFVNIGERTNVAGSKKFARLIRENKYDEAIEIARSQVDGGARILDVNMDDGLLDARNCMINFLNRLAAEPDIARFPIMIDSSDFDVIEAGLKCVQGKCIVNSVSLKDGEEKFRDQARKILRYGAAVTVMAFDEKGQAETFERKIEVCKRAYDILVGEVKFPPCDIIFDPGILSIATGIREHNNYAVDFIEAVKRIKTDLPYAKVTGGISNLSFSFRGNNDVREAMHSVFLYHAVNAGMDMGIVNAGMLQVYDDINPDLLRLVEDAVLNRRPDAAERLAEAAAGFKSDKTDRVSTETIRSGTIEERIIDALVKGTDTYIEEYMHEALQKYADAAAVIEQPLMQGMSKAGDLFGSGKMFLPQVIKSARVMKRAVSILRPVIEKQNSNSGKTDGTIVLSTVKGDVHDIGKNIVSAVLSCNNYKIIDTGVMTPCDKIVQTAVDENADMIGLSGLITPSLDEMIKTAEEMERRGMKIPLLIGGATTSRLHTAAKIAPVYSGPVIHVRDASRSVTIVGNLLSNDRQRFIEDISLQYEKLRKTYESERCKTEFLSLQDARNNRFTTDYVGFKPAGVEICKNIVVEYSIDRLRDFIDWNRFFPPWQLKGKYPRILEDPLYGDEARSLYDKAGQMLDVMSTRITLRGVFGIYPARSDGDDIRVFADEDRKTPLKTFRNLRNQLKRAGVKNYCLSDFIGSNDYLGMFAVTAGAEAESAAAEYKAGGDEYSYLIVKLSADRLAEAFAEKLHSEIRRTYWGYAKDESEDVAELFSGKYAGIRCAPGYPACPDHSEKVTLFDLLDVKKNIGVSLTSGFMMTPPASVCALVFANPESKYFRTGKITDEQLHDYAARKGINIDCANRYLATVVVD